MSPFDAFVVGNDAGWHLAFSNSDGDVLGFGSGDYDASILASLPGGLEAGAYRFVIEGITNADFALLHAAWTRPDDTLRVALSLYWRDTAGGALGRLADLAGLDDALDASPPDGALVAKLAVTRLSRRVGTRRYEAVIEACELVWHALDRRLPRQPAQADDLVALTVSVAQLMNVDAVGYPPAQADPSTDGAPLPPRAGRSATAVLDEFASAMRLRYRLGGRSPLLVRDGRLHVGPGRPIPLEDTDDVELDDAGGLVHVEASGASQALGQSAPSPGTVPPRTQYAVVLKGRPDLKPGDVVRVPRPVDDAVTTPDGLLDALAGLGSALAGVEGPAGAPVRVYVSGVTHELSRTRGFSTTLAGVEIGADDAWDPVPTDIAADGSDPDPGAGVESGFASVLRSWVGAPDAPIAVAQVRAATARAGGDLPARTVDLRLGTVTSDGAPLRAHRLDVEHANPSAARGVPVATPFAWGPFGLVLPRYPGMRVLVGHAGGASDDPVELGSLWDAGRGPDAEPGDWWLVLPAAIPASQRAAVDDATDPPAPAGAASNDLIDADGARIVEVGRLTVRVQPGQLAAAGTRPQPPQDSDEHVTIEHANGSRIVIHGNGDIVVTAQGDLKISATGNLDLHADKDVNISADAVKVQVNTTMDVS